jgi:hypothetical protein
MTMDRSQAEELGVYQNMNESKDVRDELGPLPLIPNDAEVLQRMSVFSEIYEEIMDPITRFVDL